MSGTQANRLRLRLLQRHLPGQGGGHRSRPPCHASFQTTGLSCTRNQSLCVRNAASKPSACGHPRTGGSCTPGRALGFALLAKLLVVQHPHAPLQGCEQSITMIGSPFQPVSAGQRSARNRQPAHQIEQQLILERLHVQSFLQLALTGFRAPRVCSRRFELAVAFIQLAPQGQQVLRLLAALATQLPQFLCVLLRFWCVGSRTML